VREITLLGQNVNAYHGLENSKRRQRHARRAAVSVSPMIPGLERLRYTTEPSPST
jgi:tRNA-2-methylthio-N6-dimethylallyladenosine synthase